MLKVRRFIFNPFYENTYIVCDDVAKESAIIDPGCYDEDERKSIDEFINTNSLFLKYLINTHCHIDHIFGNFYLINKYKPIYLAPAKDLFLLDFMVESAKSYDVELQPSPKPNKLISELEQLELGSSIGKFIFTPGHSPGEFCLYFGNEKICFTGDVLFKGSIGRTDLWGGDFETLINSIRTKLFVLPDDVTIYPGHESSSTIGEEKKSNPFFNDNN